MRALQPAPSTDPVKMGAKLRATRLAQGMTMDQLALAAGLTKGAISRIERDENSPSVASLVTICQVLSLPVGALFEVPVHEVVRLADAPRINMGGEGAHEVLLTPRSESRVQILRSRLTPGSTGGTQLYTINCDVEAVHVLSGSVALRFASTEVQLTPGDTFTFSGTEPHSWINRASTPADVIWVIAPAAWSGSA